MSFFQKIFKFFLSDESFEQAKAESQMWYFKCDCGNEFSIWDNGGIRYKAKGKPFKLTKCNKCQKTAMRKLFKRQSIIS